MPLGPCRVSELQRPTWILQGPPGNYLKYCFQFWGTQDKEDMDILEEELGDEDFDSAKLKSLTICKERLQSCFYK